MSFEEIAEIIADQLKIDVDKIKPESKLIDDLKADSLDIVELVMELEQRFNLEIPDDVMPTIVTVKDVVDYIEKNA